MISPDFANAANGVDDRRGVIVEYATGEAKELSLRPTFDRRIKLEFHSVRITSDGRLLAYRELDDALGLTEIAITKLLDGRRGNNARHTLGRSPEKLRLSHLAAHANPHCNPFGLAWRAGTEQRRLRKWASGGSR
jgi:hypothetical protein